MPFVVDIDDARAQFPEYEFVAPLTPSEQKAAFHVKDQAGKELCLKIIAPSCDIDRVQREILALQQISHPNVVSLKEYTFSTTSGRQRHFLVEEFIAGADLTTRLQGGTPWTRPEAADLFGQLADGLAALRSAGVVHRDLKPGNVRVALDGRPVIIDFGLARHLGLTDLTRTADGARLGTPLYFAPEQWQGTKRDIDHRTDLFSFGILLYQAVVGRHPFLTSAVTNMNELQYAMCNSLEYQQDPAFVALPKEWKLLITRLLSPERGRRPQEPIQVAQILRKIRDV